MDKDTLTSARRVNPRAAHEVAESLLAARSTPRDPTVRAAYDQLEQQSDHVFTVLTRVSASGGVRVVFTRCRVPYSSDREMVAAVRTDRLLEVTTADTEPSHRHPLMGCEPGGAFDRFRAVHDIVGHVFPRLGFDRNGEFAAWLTQDRLYRGLARWALATELHGKHSVLWTTGEPSGHTATLLDRDLLARASRGSDETTAS
jgi:hypothetical protein